MQDDLTGCGRGGVDTAPAPTSFLPDGQDTLTTLAGFEFVGLDTAYPAGDRLEVQIA